MEFVYRDINLKETEDVGSLSRVITKILKEHRPGEYRLQPLAPEVFDAWGQKHRDFKTKLQYCNKILIISVMRPIHDRSADIVIQELLITTLQLCPGARLMFGTGLTKLKNNVRKNSDQGLFSYECGTSLIYPGIVVETGDSDSRKKSGKDIRLWLNNSELNVKFGIVCKVAVNNNKNITTLLFDIYDFDVTSWSRAYPQGQPRLVKTLDFSAYNGTAQTLPPNTTFEFPSYALFPDGIYPAAYPAHPNPPPTILTIPPPQPQRPTRMDPNIVPPPIRDLHGAKLDQVNKQIQLYNTQRQPVGIDFRHICDMIRMVKWNI